MIFEVSIADGTVFVTAGILLDLVILYYMWQSHMIANFQSEIINWEQK